MKLVKLHTARNKTTLVINFDMVTNLIESVECIEHTMISLINDEVVIVAEDLYTVVMLALDETIKWD